jgi:hypothetical protein
MSSDNSGSAFPETPPGRCEADAKLIAAAPDLLEFAQQVAQVAKNHGNLFIQAWAESVCENAGFPVVLKDEPDFVAGGGK